MLTVRAAVSMSLISFRAIASISAVSFGSFQVTVSWATTIGLGSAARVGIASCENGDARLW